MSIQMKGTDTELRVEVFGPMDAVSVAQDRDAADRIAESGRNGIVLDLAGVSFMDASGLGFLTHINKRAVANGQEMRLDNVSGQPRALLESLGLRDIFRIGKAPVAAPVAAMTLQEAA